MDKGRTVGGPSRSQSPLSHVPHRFKLRLRPRTMQLNMNGMRLSPLPRGKTPVHVFGDYLGYLYTCTKSFITDTHANGSAMWASVENDIQFVLSHPNGWEGPQQTRMRKAAVYGRLVPDTDEGRARIRFVTEGEASLHACVLSGLAADVLSVRNSLCISLVPILKRFRIHLSMGSLSRTLVEGRLTSAHMP